MRWFPYKRVPGLLRPSQQSKTSLLIETEEHQIRIKGAPGSFKVFINNTSFKSYNIIHREKDQRVS